MSEKLTCSYEIGSEKIDNLLVDSFSVRYSNDIESKGNKENKIRVKNNGLKDEVYDVVFLFYGEMVSSEESKNITDAIVAGTAFSIPNLKSARERVKNFEILLRKNDFAKLVHPQRGELSVMTLSVSEKTSFMNDLGVISLSVTFTRADEILTVKAAGTTQSSILEMSAGIFNKLTEVSIGGSFSDKATTDCETDGHVEVPK